MFKNLLKLSTYLNHWTLSKDEINKINKELSSQKEFKSKDDALLFIKSIFNKHGLYREGKNVGYLDADTHEFKKFSYLEFQLNGKSYNDYVTIDPRIIQVGNFPKQKTKINVKNLSGFTFDPDRYNNDN